MGVKLSTTARYTRGNLNATYTATNNFGESLISTWVKILPDAAYRRIVVITFTASSGTQSLQIIKDPGNYITAAVGGGGAIVLRRRSTATFSAADGWIHVFAWGTSGLEIGGTKVRLWINGEEQLGTELTSSSFAPGTNGRFTIGCRTDLNDATCFTGTIAETSLWWRMGLIEIPTTEQVISIMNGAPPWSISQSDLICYSPLREKDSSNLQSLPLYTNSARVDSVSAVGVVTADDHPPIIGSGVLYFPSTSAPPPPPILNGYWRMNGAEMM